LGLRVAGWLVEQGARHLVLLGRRAPTPAARETLERWQAQGVDVLVAQADVADAAALTEALAEAAVGRPPLRGVMHAAGELADGVLVQQDWERFERVLAAKVRGAWLLHELTKDLDLDLFVLFSSAAALLGAPGQANYAAANAFLDALAHYRRGQGLPALSINWGAWSEVGMAARSESSGSQRRLGRVMRALAPADGLRTLEELLTRNEAQAAVLSVNWHELLKLYPQDAIPPMLSAEAGEHRPMTEAAPAATSGLRQQLEQAPAGSRRGLLLNELHALAAQVLGLAPSRTIDADRPLQELGLDSLMAVEFRNALGQALGETFSATVVFDHPTLNALINYLAARLPMLAIPDEHLENSRGQEKEQLRLLEEVEQLSDKEIEAFLAAELTTT
jgi:NAD(P)-dependent dehydrogenase (short-subunit alcohol dehydrogenase family)/acyl carrier protein